MRKPETVDPTDRPLTEDEAREVADSLDTWPPGLGYVIVRDETRKRGWKRFEPWTPFHTYETPPPSADIKHCPVVQLTEARDEHSYGEHLAAWRSLRDAVADVLGISLEDAHEVYNDLLKTNPAALGNILRRYADAYALRLPCRPNHGARTGGGRSG